MYQSISTIKNPEFINLTPLDINPLMSQCEIKILYVGENRNHSIISKEVAAEMAKTLRGAPIVGYFKKDEDDFGGHGEQIILDEDGIKFNSLTMPYGFVSPDSEVWFKEFEDTDEFGNTTVKEYLMTTGYLWTTQYEEALKVIDEGRPQSMELNKDSLKGHWATNPNTGIEFFIINDAIFSKLCILGLDVEPCFGGSEITSPQVSSTFSTMDDKFKMTLSTFSTMDDKSTFSTMDDKFKMTLFSMMKDLKAVINSSEGGLGMNKEELINSGKKPSAFTDEEKALFSTEEYKDLIEKEKAEAQQEAELEYSEVEEEEEEIEDEEEEDGESVEEKFTLLQKNHEELQEQFSTLEEEVKELRSFKTKIEDIEKDKLIEKFYMLSDEDKKDIIEHKAEYSFEDIKAKLAVIAFDKKVSFEETSEEEEEEDNGPALFSLEEVSDDAPAFVHILREVQNTED